MEGVWLYLHILLLVFWVGTDVGVFIAARWSEQTTLSIETRQTVLQLGMVLDRLLLTKYCCRKHMLTHVDLE